MLSDVCSEDNQEQRWSKAFMKTSLTECSAGTEPAFAPSWNVQRLVMTDNFGRFVVFSSLTTVRRAAGSWAVAVVGNGIEVAVVLC